MTTKVAVVGATGKLGSLAVRLIERADDLELFAALDSRAPLSDMDGADIVFDATVPAASQDIVEHAIRAGLNVLVGTSGWSSERIGRIERSIADLPSAGIVFVPNFSIGSVLATSFAAMAARFYDSIEIVEAHGATKVDSPSGTAVRTAELIGAARQSTGPVIAPHADQRARGQQVSSVPIHSLRMKGVVARQDVIFGGSGEVLTVSHETIDSSSYELGLLVGLRATAAARGVTVGLDKLIELGAVA